MESVWIIVRKVSLWTRRTRSVSLVITTVVPVGGHDMTTATPARTSSL